MRAGGAVEGAALGAAQWWALRRQYPRLGARPWLGTTALAGASAWMLGGLPSTLVTFLGPARAGPSSGRGSLVLGLGALVGGAVLGTIFGVLQWTTLRDHAVRAGAWIVGNAVGWALALPWSFLAASPWVATPGRAVAATAAAGLAMGALVAAATGAALRRMPQRCATGWWRSAAGVTGSPPRRRR